ncbi:RNA polymerase sigma factor [Brevundimonas sp.]|uniref:RNA polymerase sigma factor n=1 Tax=Brevundimonas sp. TaxID=1871086 RepID=UPI002FCB0AEE
MHEDNAKIVAWLGREILPHEADVRRWLRRSRLATAEIEDIVQDAYCRLSALTDTAHILSPRAYFFTVTRNVLLDHVRRARVVRMETVAEIDALNIPWDAPTPEVIAGARRELERISVLISKLPDRCRRIFVMRKIEGLSQREIAATLGVTETIVENDVVRGLRLILKAIAEDEKPETSLSRNKAKSIRARNSRDH